MPSFLPSSDNSEPEYNEIDLASIDVWGHEVRPRSLKEEEIFSKRVNSLRYAKRQETALEIVSKSATIISFNNMHTNYLACQKVGVRSG